jgi:hypothetical protein
MFPPFLITNSYVDHDVIRFLISPTSDIRHAQQPQPTAQPQSLRPPSEDLYCNNPIDDEP